MIVTHTQNADGQRRVYLGGKGSLECWIDPKSGGQRWTFHLAEAVSGTPLSPNEQREWATHMLLSLARELNVSPLELHDVPFEAIAALNSHDPFEGRRVATPRRNALDKAFVSAAPHITRPREYTAPRREFSRQRR